MDITTKTEKLNKEWQDWVKKNTDPYSQAVIDVIVKVCKELDKGKTPEEAEHEIQFWFAPEEIHDYKRAEEDIMF